MKLFKNLTGLIMGFFLFLGATLLYGTAIIYFTGAPAALAYTISGGLCLVAGSTPLVRSVLFEGLSQLGARMMYQNAKELLAGMTDPMTGRPMYDISQAKLTMSYVRGEAALAVGKSNYSIPIIKNTNPSTRINQNLITLQDIFVANQIGVFIGIGSATNSAAKLYTYGSQIAFSTSGAAAALLSVYNGQLQLLNNNEQVVPAWDLLRHYKVPAIQAITDLYYDGTAVQQDQLDMSADGFYPNEPGWVINGAGNMVMSVVCGEGPAAIQADSFVCVILRGILFQNVTTVK
jgi:hypothetical protein